MKHEKPDFLKTFSEFRIDELRKMPVGRVFSLFFQEVKMTLGSEPAPSPKTVKTKKRAKKNANEVILTGKVAKRKPFAFPALYFSAKVRTMLTSAEVTKTAVEKKEGTERKTRTPRIRKEETVVFQNAGTTKSIAAS